MSDPEETLREQAAIRQDETLPPDWAEQVQIEADQEARHGLTDPWEDWNAD